MLAWVEKRWPDEKAQIVAESFQPDAAVTDIARRHGCRPQQVHGWRRIAHLGQLSLPASADTVSFVPLVSESSRPTAAELSGSPEAAVVTVELLGVRVEVRGAPSFAVLSDMFMACRNTTSGRCRAMTGLGPGLTRLAWLTPMHRAGVPFMA
ncbi:transposase [Bradyrhizobium diversitatis]|uniref:Transposase n=1 Tax=Bradyrhizobium diversitatis TaxID=2755406 RepID=A0ABS0PBG6_9BRAD|nr:transposase [Bradyrhizobium diversitatis]